MERTKHSSIRITEAILDLDYGDEQERLRYYEAYAVMVHLQLILFPLAGAIALFAFGSAATAPVLILLSAGFAPIFVGKAYLKRRNVRLELIATSARNRLFAGAYFVACSALIVALVAKGGFESNVALAAGAVAGAGLAVAVVSVRYRQQRDADAVDSDVEA
jgi:hypothetical protein